MSGGSMNYAYYQIGSAADCIQRELAEIEFRVKSGVPASEIVGNIYDGYRKEHPEKKYLKSPEALLKEVIKNMRAALRIVRRSAIYAERVEWLTSGDDGYESFCLRLDEELGKSEKQGGAV